MEKQGFDAWYAKEEARRHAGKRRGNYLLIRVIKRVIRMTNNTASIVSKVWSFCTTLRDDRSSFEVV
jgi:hypothetical protein